MASLEALDKRNVGRVRLVTCNLWGDYEETTYRLLSLTLQRWCGNFLTTGVKFNSSMSVWDLLKIHETSNPGQSKKRRYTGSCSWHVDAFWKPINEINFSKKPASFSKTMEDIKSLGTYGLKTVHLRKTLYRIIDVSSLVILVDSLFSFTASC